MITPTRSIFIGLLWGLLGVALGGLFVTVIMRETVTTADLLPLAFAGVLCGAWGALRTEHKDIERQRLSDKLSEDERRAKLAPVAVAVPVVSAAIAESRELADDDGWYTFLWTWLTNVHRAGGASHGLMGQSISEAALTALHDFYTSDLGEHVLRLEPGNVGHVLNTPLWTHTTVMAEVANHALPHPKGRAPDVEVLYSVAPRRGERRGIEQGRGVVDAAR